METNILGRAPFLEIWKVRKNFDRVGIATWVFLFSLVGIILGFSIRFFRTFALMGLLILVIYVSVVVAFFKIGEC